MAQERLPMTETINEEASNSYIDNLGDCRNSGVERVYR